MDTTSVSWQDCLYVTVNAVCAELHQSSFSKVITALIFCWLTMKMRVKLRYLMLYSTMREKSKCEEYFPQTVTLDDIQK